MMEEQEGLFPQVIRAMMEKSGLANRLCENSMTAKFQSWAYMKDGKPTLDWGILLMKTMGDKEQCVGMYHFQSKKILISRISFGPGGCIGLTQFAYQMDECKDADDFYKRLPTLLETFAVAKNEVKNEES